MAVPAEYKTLIEDAGNTCPEVSPNLLAALLTQESGFNPKASSPVGAQGIAQFYTVHVGNPRNRWQRRRQAERLGPRRRHRRPQHTSARSPTSRMSPVTGRTTCLPLTTREVAPSRSTAAFPRTGNTELRPLHQRPRQPGRRRRENRHRRPGDHRDQKLHRECSAPPTRGAGKAKGPSRGICCSPNGSTGSGYHGF
ncbi:transglycosylase SLT domain-containing protein [Streptomyces parvulus]